MTFLGSVDQNQTYTVLYENTFCHKVSFKYSNSGFYRRTKILLSFSARLITIRIYSKWFDFLSAYGKGKETTLITISALLHKQNVFVKHGYPRNGHFFRKL